MENDKNGDRLATIILWIGIAVVFIVIFSVAIIYVGGIRWPAGIAEILISIEIEIAAIIFLLAYYIKRKYPLKKVILRIGLVVVFVVIFSVAIIYASGILWFEKRPNAYSYKISVRGLNNYSSGVVTDIIVPLPMLNGEQGFSDSELQNESFGNWTSKLVVTKYGKMLAFQTQDRSLTNIDASFYKSFYGYVDISREMLAPLIDETPAGYTQWVYNDSNIKGYTTLVYIDNTIQPKHPDNNTIIFDLQLSTGGGSYFGTVGFYKTNVYEQIPEGITGIIPVRTQIWKW